MSVVNLTKGNKINLSKATVDLAKKAGGSKNLGKIYVGLGWASASQTQNPGGGVAKKGLLAKLFGGGTSSNTSRGPEIDCDAFAVIVAEGSKTNEKGDLVWYSNLRKGDVIKHAGDNLVGGSDGDDERIHIALDKVDSSMNEVLVGVNIYQGVQRGQHFGMLQDAYIRVVDEDRNVELARYKLDNTNEGVTTLFFGRFQRDGDDWDFVAVGDKGRDGGIPSVVADYLKTR